MWNINEDLSKITAWCCHNSLLINPDKTKVLVLGTSKMLQRLPDDFHVTLLDKRITPTISARDLGIQFDSTLSFNEHIANTVSTCIPILCQINRVKHLFDPRMLWNSLPCNITVHDNSKDFKSKLYNYLFELFLLKS